EVFVPLSTETLQLGDRGLVHIAIARRTGAEHAEEWGCEGVVDRPLDTGTLVRFVLGGLALDRRPPAGSLGKLATPTLGSRRVHRLSIDRDRLWEALPPRRREFESRDIRRLDGEPVPVPGRIDGRALVMPVEGVEPDPSAVRLFE